MSARRTAGCPGSSAWRESTIAGLFVAKPERSRGVGKQLLDAAKAAHDYLELRVYAENWPAVKFYYREGFTLCSQDVDGSTGADGVPDTRYLRVRARSIFCPRSTTRWTF